jgi:archaellum component FlaC
MMRTYGLTEGTAYVETHTLLEPNNFIPSWEAGDEEKKEVSNALLRLRKDYDQIHKLAVEKDNALIQLKADIKKAQEEERVVSRDFGGASADTENSSDFLKHLTTTHDF